MNKVAKGKARVEKLTSVIDDVLAQDDAGLRSLQESGFITKDGLFSRRALADAIGMDTLPDTFRQNSSMKIKIKDAEEKLKQRKIILIKDCKVGKTTEEIGKDNENKFLSWLVRVGTKKLPAPINHYNRLYKKALWSEYAEQDLLDIKRIPTWFTSRPNVKEALDALNVKVVKGLVVTRKMDNESIADDLEGSMTSALVRKLRTEVKELREKLDSEVEARKNAELKASQNEILVKQASTGKMSAH